MKTGAEVLKFIESLSIDKKNTKAAVRLIFKEIKEKNIRQFSYNYDYNSIIPTNVEKETKQFFKSYIFHNNIKNKLIKVVRNASEYGISGILLRIGNSSIIAQNIYILNQPTYHNEILLNVELTVDHIDLKKYDEKNLETMRLWLNAEGKYVLSHMVYHKTEGGESYDFANGEVQLIKTPDGDVTTREYVYDAFEGCPLEILENNESAKGDWEYAGEMLRLTAKFENEINDQWPYLKVQLINNVLANHNLTAADIQAMIEDPNKNVLDFQQDPDSLAGPPISSLSAGGVTAEIARIIKENYKEEIQQITFAFGTLTGGNNKHTSEAIMSFIDAFKYLFIKKVFFETFIAKLLFKIISYSNILVPILSFKSEEQTHLEFDIKFSKVIELILSNSDTQKPKQAMSQPKQEPKEKQT